jgi:hypothetical protein
MLQLGLVRAGDGLLYSSMLFTAHSSSNFKGNPREAASCFITRLFPDGTHQLEILVYISPLENAMLQLSRVLTDLISCGQVRRWAEQAGMVGDEGTRQLLKLLEGAWAASITIPPLAQQQQEGQQPQQRQPEQEQSEEQQQGGSEAERPSKMGRSGSFLAPPAAGQYRERLLLHALCSGKPGGIVPLHGPPVWDQPLLQRLLSGVRDFALGLAASSRLQQQPSGQQTEAESVDTYQYKSKKGALVPASQLQANFSKDLLASLSNALVWATAGVDSSTPPAETTPAEAASASMASEAGGAGAQGGAGDGVEAQEQEQQEQEQQDQQRQQQVTQAPPSGVPVDQIHVYGGRWARLSQEQQQHLGPVFALLEAIAKKQFSSSSADKENEGHLGSSSRSTHSSKCTISYSPT